jgi:hypothetical protein
MAETAIEWLFFGHRRSGHTLFFEAGIAFFEQVDESDSGGVEWVVGSEYPVGLRRLAPTDDVVTDYDRAHLQQYVRLLDARTQGVSTAEMCRQILEIDPAATAEEAEMTLKSHLDRAVWLTSVGFRQL